MSHGCARSYGRSVCFFLAPEKGSHMNMQTNLHETRSDAMSLQTFSATLGDKDVEVGTLLVNGEPWFKGVDVAAALGYTAPAKAVRTHVPDDDKQEMHTLGGGKMTPLLQGNQGACVYISESGLYSLIFQSKKDEAKGFQRWITKDILPSIRRTGKYFVQPELQEEYDEPLPTIELSAVTEAQQWDARRARLDALASSHTLATQVGISLGEAHMRAIRDVLNEVILPLGQQQGDMIDAAKILTRKGHTHAEILKLASEFGRALKTAWERTHLEAPVTNLEQFGSGENNIRQYHARDDALFIDAVYEAFQKRELYQRLCPDREKDRVQYAQSVQDALKNTRGFASSSSATARPSHELQPAGRKRPRGGD